MPAFVWLRSDSGRHFGGIVCMDYGDWGNLIEIAQAFTPPRNPKLPSFFSFS